MIDIIYHGHSFVEIDLWGESILIDPYITDNKLCDISLQTICSKNIIAICITHGHSDHIWDTVEIVNKTWAKIISTFEVIQYFTKYHNILSSYSMHVGWEHNFPINWSNNFWEFKVKFVNAVHWWAIWPEFFPWKAAWIVLEIWWKKIYHAWDTALTYDMKLLENKNIDVAFLPIWWNFTMWIEDAVKATEFIKPKIVIPIHYNTFETIKANPTNFAQKIMLNNLANCKVLTPGQSIVFDNI